MPHKNPKVNKYETDTLAVLKSHGKGHAKTSLSRGAMKAAGVQIIANLRDAVAAGQPTLNEAIDHTEANLDTILDAVEAAS